MMKLLPYVIVYVILSACGGSSAPAEKDSLAVRVVDADPGKGVMEITTRTGSHYYVSESHPRGASISDILVYTSSSADTIRMTDADPITSLLVNDLDGDGKDELYIVTSSAGSGSYGKVTVFRGAGDERIQRIDLAEGGEGEGYMGRDRFQIDSVSHVLLRSFPVYREGDANSNPTGGERTIKYKFTTDSTLIPVK